ncbi:hypothetical protein E2C01_077041 [Portunus trituberculatus]|uniref:Uncharacterized protein n=1 Tax=Portunus trituberculatus TaxID=210409 RepID=A0A5B7IL69_PORTR|nr:hypothetical protein [Portunus trituberculatus]
MEYFLGYLLSQSPPVRKPNLHSDRGQDSNPCTWRPLGPQSTHGSTVPRRTETFIPSILRCIFYLDFLI